MTSSLKTGFRIVFFLVSSLILAVIAVGCTSDFVTEIQNTCFDSAPPGASYADVQACIDFVSSVCPVPSGLGSDEFKAQTCLMAAVYAFYHNQAMPPVPDYNSVSGAHPSTPTPTELVLPQPPPPSYCDGFRMSSPLDGLPNGAVMFYWDPPFNQSATYQVTVMDENHTILAAFPAGTDTHVNGDVSQAAIGGGFQLWVRVSAFLYSTTCTDEHLLMRAAPDNTNVNPVAPPATRTVSPHG